MKDAYQVLYQKESELARVRKEIESLTIAAQLLADGHLGYLDTGMTIDGNSKKPVQKATSPKLPVADGQPFVWPRLGFWGSLRIRRHLG